MNVIYVNRFKCKFIGFFSVHVLVVYVTYTKVWTNQVLPEVFPGIVNTQATIPIRKYL